MNREIEFKAKRADDGSWVCGDLENNRKRNIVRIHTYKNDGSYNSQYIVDSDTVGQFIGTCDKNGKRIYEGDIVRGDHYPFMSAGENNYLGVVFFSDEDLTFQKMLFVTKDAKVSGISNFINTEFSEEDGEHYEVIGNIFDNLGLFRNSDEDIIKWFVGEY